MKARIGMAGSALLALAGCNVNHTPAPTPTPAHYVVGSAYQAGGVWYYPREQTRYEATGLAAIISDHAGQTADGETFDATALAGAHQTLQLPAILRVTNMQNGRQLLLRLNDRGPAGQGRLLAMTRHAADLLQAVDGSEIHVQLDEGMTRTLADQLGGGPRVDLALAPRDAVQSESLAPPPGTGQSGRGATAPGATTASAAPDSGPAVPDRLPDQVSQGAPEPGQIWLRASEFGRIDYAQRLAAQLYGLNPVVQTVPSGRDRRYSVRAGPFSNAAEADMALDQAQHRGVIDARLVVE
ncbi:MAG: SPOR domain-containing protein [Janthinobacterium lividum]